MIARSKTGASEAHPEPAVGCEDGLIDFVLHVSHGQDRASSLPSSSLPSSSLPSSYLVDGGYWRRAAVQHPAVHAGAGGYHFRLITQYGLNLYCAACRQLALATSDREEARRAVDRHTRLLLADEAGELRSLRAWSDESGGWRYGDEATRLERRAGSAYFFGAICDRLELVDPLTGETHFPAELGGSRLRWSYFDPFLGETAWASLIAPLQIACRKWRAGAAPAQALVAGELRLARSSLRACKAMQTALGGIYARPAADGEPQERMIVNEANLTLYSGLLMLRRLAAELGSREPEDHLIDELLDGLRSYFAAHLYGAGDDGGRLRTCAMLEGGELLPDTGAAGQAVPFAVDVHTWGMSILGVAEIDSRLGAGACHELWRQVKRHAGYYPEGRAQGPLKGVGFSSSPGGEPVHDVCSPEWTFGAINMCRILAAEYEAPGPHRDVALARRFRADEATMLAGVMELESAADTGFPCRAYPYVNRFHDTGFTWYAIPVASLCATAWAILVRERFNPFRLGGGYLSSGAPDPAPGPRRRASRERV